MSQVRVVLTGNPFDVVEVEERGENKVISTLEERVLGMSLGVGPRMDGLNPVCRKGPE